MSIKFQNLLKIVFIFIVLISAFGSASAQKELLRRKEALLIAEQTPEGQAFYELNGGKYVNCIEKSVMKPCETNWVTCIDDAWVVKLQYGEVCGFKHDERMDLMIVVDAKDGRIISKYPEAMYFTTPQHCQNSNDCLSVSEGDNEQCLNFVYGQLIENHQSTANCQCVSNKCELSQK